MHGQFSWYDLMTTDTKGAEAFYRDVVGWNFAAYDAPGQNYTIVQVGEAGVGGMMDLPQNARAMGAPPFWIAYISVDDVDAAAEKAKGLGATILHPPTDIPDVGRFAVVADPQGAHFNLFRPNPTRAPLLPPEGAPGTFGWRELMTSDLDAAFGFYAAMFGWTKGDVHDMGAHGPYQLFNAGAGGPPTGGMMKKPENIPAPPAFWSYYINVDSAKAAVERITKAGGKVLNGPMQVPTGQWIAQAMDPQGGHFAVLSHGE